MGRGLKCDRCKNCLRAYGTFAEFEDTLCHVKLKLCKPCIDSFQEWLTKEGLKLSSIRKRRKYVEYKECGNL